MPEIDQPVPNSRPYFAAMNRKNSSFQFLGNVINSSDTTFEEPGQLPDTLTKAQAYSLYGGSRIDCWITEGLIHFVRQRGSSSKKFADRLKLEALARSGN